LSAVIINLFHINFYQQYLYVCVDRNYALFSCWLHGGVWVSVAKSAELPAELVSVSMDKTDGMSCRVHRHTVYSSHDVIALVGRCSSTTILVTRVATISVSVTFPFFGDASTSVGAFKFIGFTGAASLVTSVSTVSLSVADVVV
jgi:hypothetical protein